jgi:hypothetical protein
MTMRRVLGYSTIVCLAFALGSCTGAPYRAEPAPVYYPLQRAALYPEPADAPAAKVPSAGAIASGQHRYPPQRAADHPERADATATRVVSAGSTALSRHRAAGRPNWEQSRDWINPEP